ncbi:hypothetical protein DFH27DRAFT_612091 [Peziza echinospora]|nr:hypothetical protein DFH27DRAFT_612091 [Peziza echinospora]
MYSASVLSRGSMVSTMMHNVQMSRPQITISLTDEERCAYGDDVAKAKATTFTTLDKITGEVCFSAPSDTRFDEIHIMLQGQSRVWMERFGAVPGGPMSSTQTVSRQSAAQGGDESVRESRTPFLTTSQFLKLVQPIDEAAYPVPRIAEKGRKYTFPFTFVVPEQLLANNCGHRHMNDTVAAAHLSLPPSLGDGSTPTIGGCHYDDLSPDMTRIGYSINVRLLKKRESDGQSILLATETRKIRIVPVFEDLPPQIIDGKDKDLCLTKERIIRKGFLKGKMGTLTVTAQQPRPLQGGICAHANGAPPTTSLPVKVTFTPIDNSQQPPTLNSLSTKVRAHTFFSTNPIAYFPTPSAVGIDGSLGRYHESVLMGTQSLGGVKWTKSSESTSEQPTYTTDITLPIVSPKCKVLVPSFHSCLVSRTYTVEVHLDVHTPGYNMGAHPGVTLKIPLQVSRPASSDSQRSRQEIEDSELPGFGEEYFTPRRIALPESRPSSTSSSPRSSLTSPSSPASLDFMMRLPVPEQVPIVTSTRSNVQSVDVAHPPPPGYSVFNQQGTLPVRIPSPVGISPRCG